MRTRGPREPDPRRVFRRRDEATLFSQAGRPSFTPEHVVPRL
jgi:hypothetical protein